ncbi:hypothetical protein TNCV_3176651 [Trichonephila clavipes]|nr:hypothetical protein TNCV_3176651 [Trichonephila clavipes]
MKHILRRDNWESTSARHSSTVDPLAGIQAEALSAGNRQTIRKPFAPYQRVAAAAQLSPTKRCSLSQTPPTGGMHSEGILFFSRSCQVIYSQFGLAIHQNDHQARRRFVEWAQNEIAVVPDFHKRILFSDEAHFWLNGYVNKQNCRIWSEANPQVYVETPLHPEKLTVWSALWAGGILLQKR